MALKNQRPRANRYKKSGKGRFALAAFLVCFFLLLTGGYLLHRHQTQKSPLRITSKQIVQKPAPHRKISTTASSPAADDATQKIKQDYHTGDLRTPANTSPQRPQTATGTGKPELVILIDDMGSSLQEAQALANIGVTVNFAIIPSLRQFREVADFAANKGIEVLIHIPMQSKEYPRRRLEANGLLLEHKNEELQSRMSGYLEALPQAVGANNHMGSGFTEDTAKMRVVLQVLKQNGLFFLDSITSPQTVGSKVAAELGMHHARRDVFLDNEQNESYIRGQLAQAVARARKNGRAIAICHPHPVTIATLSKALPELKTQGVTLVAVSRVVK